jgi:protein-S-isoprenylcysteine O-methyltransferase Ste14
MSTNTESQNTAGIPFPPPLAFLGGLGLGFALQHFFPVHIQRGSLGIDVLERIGEALVLAAVALASSAFISLRLARTSPFPERPTTSLVVRGPFRFTRNPLYVSMSLVHTGVSVFANALWPLLFLVPAVLSIRYLVIAREERYLTRRFGADYGAYCRRVRRWL